MNVSGYTEDSVVQTVAHIFSCDILVSLTHFLNFSDKVCVVSDELYILYLLFINIRTVVWFVQ
jgi:hypothetical protein